MMQVRNSASPGVKCGSSGKHMFPLQEWSQYPIRTRLPICLSNLVTELAKDRLDWRKARPQDHCPVHAAGGCVEEVLGASTQQEKMQATCATMVSFSTSDHKAFDHWGRTCDIP